MIPIQNYQFGEEYQKEVEKTWNTGIERTLITLSPTFTRQPELLELDEYGYTPEEAKEEYRRLYAAVQDEKDFRKTEVHNHILKTVARYVSVNIQDKTQFAQRIPEDIRDEVIATLTCWLADITPISVPNSEIVWQALDLIDAIENWWDSPVFLLTSSGNKSAVPERK